MGPSHQGPSDGRKKLFFPGVYSWLHAVAQPNIPLFWHGFVWFQKIQAHPLRYYTTGWL